MTTTNKITKKDNYLCLREMVALDGHLDNETQDRLLNFIDHELELMDARTEKAKKYQREHNAADDDMSKAIYSILLTADAPMSLADIAAKVKDATPQKVTYRLSKLYDNGFIKKETHNFKPEGSAMNKRVTVYQLINTQD